MPCHHRGRATVMVIVRVILGPDDDASARAKGAVFDCNADMTVWNVLFLQSNSTRAQFFALNGQSRHPVEQHPCFLLLSLYMESLLVSLISVLIMMAEQLTKMSLGAKRCVLSALLPSVMDSIIIWPCSLSSASMSPNGVSIVAVMVEYSVISGCVPWTL